VNRIIESDIDATKAAWGVFEEIYNLATITY